MSKPELIMLKIFSIIFGLISIFSLYRGIDYILTTNSSKSPFIIFIIIFLYFGILSILIWREVSKKTK